MQRDLVDLQLHGWRTDLDQCSAALQRVESWLHDTVAHVDPARPQNHALSVLQQRVALDEQCQVWRRKQQQVQKEIQKLFTERNRIQGEMKKYELLLEEEEQRERKKESVKLENQTDDFVLRQWTRGAQDSEVQPC